MNEERYVLAEFKRRIIMIDRMQYAKKQYHSDFNITEILTMIAEIEADAVLGEETESEAEKWESLS